MASKRQRTGTKNPTKTKTAKKRPRSYVKSTSARSNASKKRLSPVERKAARSHGQLASRFEGFEKLAKERADGDLVLLPRMLKGSDRTLYVRQTLREDHQDRIYVNREGARAKFDKLSESAYSFFRGTCLLFYRDMAGEDAWMPTVLTLGDLHPENFGVMPSRHNTPMFGVNDFDEAYYAPFTWDLKRGAVGFWLAALEQGHKKKTLRRTVKALVHGYFEGLEAFASDSSETSHQVRRDNAPPIVADLLERSMRDRDEWLSKYVDDKTGGFYPQDDIVPLSGRVDEFQRALRAYARDTDLPARAGELKVKDVAERKGAGTASIGLPRYYVLIEGPTGDGSDDLIIELKHARRSALCGLAPPSQHASSGTADRVVNAQAVHLVDGDPFYGKAELGGTTFLVRERSPFKKEIDLSDLSKSDWKRYAACCGRSLAQSHALSDDLGRLKGNTEARILEAVRNRHLFIDDVVVFAEEAVTRICADYEQFLADHARGAYEHVDRVFA